MVLQTTMVVGASSAAAVPDVDSVLGWIIKGSGSWHSYCFGEYILQFQVEKMIRNCLHSHGVDNNIHSQFCLRSMFLIPSITV